MKLTKEIAETSYEHIEARKNWIIFKTVSIRFQLRVARSFVSQSIVQFEAHGCGIVARQGGPIFLSNV
ncbi:hypothetical protein V1478_010491 [Vespula squamosa]|uniref:Uncharacterized protein n=1 Tax=Vespula squamosa TaxID=30214 RepID=A0ABD2AI73_VESSQ